MKKNLDSDTNEVLDTIPVGGSSHVTAYNYDNGNMCAASTNSNSVSVIGSIVPIADAGIDHTVDSGVTMQLDGCGGTDPRNETLTYQWTQTSGPSVTLDDPTSVNPTFTAPNIETQQNLVFELVVTTNQCVESQPDSVTITVTPSDNPPIPPPFEGVLV